MVATKPSRKMAVIAPESDGAPASSVRRRAFRLLSAKPPLLMTALTVALPVKMNVEDRGDKGPWATFHPMLHPLVVRYVAYGWPVPFVTEDADVGTTPFGVTATYSNPTWHPLAMCADLGAWGLLTAGAAIWGIYGRPVPQFTLLTPLLLPVLVGLLIALAQMLHVELRWPSAAEVISLGLAAGILFVAVTVR